MATYSFLDVQASITGPGGSFSLGSGSGVAEEGIDIKMAEDKDAMHIGADGTAMHVLIPGKSGTISIRLLKTSPKNAKLMAMYDAQALSSALWAQNVITVTQTASGDVTTARSVAFRKKADLTYSKDPTMNEWEFNCGYIDSILGTY